MKQDSRCKLAEKRRKNGRGEKRKDKKEAKQLAKNENVYSRKETCSRAKKFKPGQLESIQALVPEVHSLFPPISVDLHYIQYLDDEFPEE